MRPNKCVYFPVIPASGQGQAPNPPGCCGQIARSAQEHYNQFWTVLDGKIDGYNLDSDAFNSDHITFSTQTRTAPKVLSIPFLNSGGGGSFARRKGAEGIEFITDASDATDGRVCILDKDYLSSQIISFIPDDPASVSNPGGTYKTPLGETTIDTGGAFDVIVKRNAVTGWKFGLSKSTTPFQIVSTLAVGTKPLDVTSTTLCTNLNADLLDGIDSTGFVSATVPEIGDNLFRILGSADATKKLAFEVDGFTTGTTRTLTPPNESGTIEITAHKDAASGYAGLTASTKLNLAHMQEVMAVTDMSDVTNKTGTGTAIVFQDAPALLSPDIDNFESANHSHIGLVTGGTLTVAAIPVPEWADNLFRVVGSVDATKKLAFEVDGFTTATTRTLTPPNADGTIVTRSGGLTSDTLLKWNGTHVIDSFVNEDATSAYVRIDANGQRGLRVNNFTNGTGARAISLAGVSAGDFVAMQAFSALYTPSGLDLALSGQLATTSTMTGGLVVNANGANPLIFGTNNVERAKITDAAFYFKSGTTKRFEGDATGIGLNGATPTAQGALSALTNSVTVGGSSNVIADWDTALTYEEVRSTIRNNQHQLARYIKLIGDFLRLRGDMA